MEDCIFCKIVSGKMSAQKVFEDENILVIEDIKPKAPVHLLIIPKVHVSDIIGINESTWSDIRKVALKLIKENGLKSFRLVNNGGEAALIQHMHVHLLGEVNSEREL